MSRQIRSAFLDHVAKMLELSGTPRSDAEPATRDESEPGSITPAEMDRESPYCP